jgi:serine/threonine protein kinase
MGRQSDSEVLWYAAPEIIQQAGYSWPINYFSFGRVSAYLLACRYDIAASEIEHLGLENLPEQFRDLIAALCNSEPNQRPTFSRVLAAIGDRRLILRNANAEHVLAYMRELGGRTG